MKKSLISVICLTMFMSFFGFLSDVNAVNFEGQEEKYMSEGFDGYISKPINKEKLNYVLNKYLGGK